MRTHVVSSGTLTLPCTSLFYHSYPFGLWPGRHAAQQDLSQRPDVIRQVEELMEERGVELDHATIHRWVLKYSLQLEEEFHLRKRPVGRRWRMDETYIRVKGEWRYLYRAVDTSGQTIDVLLTEHRDTDAALRFLTQAIRRHGVPELMTIDGSEANEAAIKRYNEAHGTHIIIRQVKYLTRLWPFRNRPAADQARAGRRRPEIRRSLVGR